ncbi:MAG: outer membrane protein assembly factor BamE [Pseudomonadota bacterium]|nr:MAG: outer membrane protein assembly factor BamE [Pseudomonadota bacterium]
MPTLIRVLPLLVLALAASGCLSVYRLDVPQGNVVTQEMVDLLKPGMTRNQVRFVLGSPLVTDPFHSDRWDYYYALRKGTGEVSESRHLTVYFQDDHLARIGGDIADKSAAPSASP